eukprot:14679226-Alexandrium_andersonii.AAC.1
MAGFEFLILLALTPDEFCGLQAGSPSSCLHPVEAGRTVDAAVVAGNPFRSVRRKLAPGPSACRDGTGASSSCSQHLPTDAGPSE